ncbi:hypothetical protein EK599_06550 [Vibrio sp. T187]|uniref:hypothetical protein n=1 Tax=Vibrio TaxID=662 RepID=UPI0010CA1EE6|nr:MULTISPECIES: hypothetical protein [Vibrio]MBW3695346.1 hypothetical protein [Vibrio sp. T187]
MKSKCFTFIGCLLYLGGQPFAAANEEAKLSGKVRSSSATIEDEAKKSYPNYPTVIAMDKVASQLSKDKIDSMATPKLKRQTAAAIFLGYYVSHTHTVTEYCQDNEADVSTYTEAFHSLHQKEFETALSVLSFNQKKFIQFYEKIRPQMLEHKALDIGYIASENRLTLNQACQFLSDNVKHWIPEMHISAIQPFVYSTLMLEN